MTRKRRPDQQYIDRKVSEVALIGITDAEELLAVEETFKGLYAIMDERFTRDVLLRLWHSKPLTEIIDEPGQWFQVGDIQVHRRALQIERRNGKIYDTQMFAFVDENDEMYFNHESEAEITLPYLVPLDPIVVPVEGAI